jgi:hypothetical protein
MTDYKYVLNVPYEQSFILPVDAPQIREYLQTVSAGDILSSAAPGQSAAINHLLAQGILQKHPISGYSPTIIGQMVIDHYLELDKKQQQELVEKQRKNELTITDSRLVTAILRALAARDVSLQKISSLEVQALFVTTLGLLLAIPGTGFLFEHCNPLPVKTLPDGKIMPYSTTVDTAMQTLKARPLDTFEDTPDKIQTMVNEIIGYFLPQLDTVVKRPEYNILAQQAQKIPLPGATAHALQVTTRQLHIFYDGQYKKFSNSHSNNPVKSFIDNCRAQNI